MSKGLFFSLPSISVSRTLIPVIDAIAASGHEIIYYNTADFQPQGPHSFVCRQYPDYFNGYYSDRIDESTSYFQFGEILIDTAACLMDFLLEEISKEKPDFILHSHLAVWGKLIAAHFRLPAITLYTTFVLDKKIMLPFFRQMNTEQGAAFRHVNDAFAFYRKSQALYDRLNLSGRPDLWDVYTNKGDLNISFINAAFQPQQQLFGRNFFFAGYPLVPISQGYLQPPASMEKKKIIYISMGTIVNRSLSFYRLCIEALKDIGLECVLSAGSKVDIAELGDLPAHITVVAFTDQPAMLRKARMFLTRGGMASVHEAISTLTPMIVFPVIPEQQLTAERIGQLGIGICLQPAMVTVESLRNAIRSILADESGYNARLKAFVAEGASRPAEQLAVERVNDFLQRTGTVVDLFRRAAAARPDAIAVRCEQRCISYKQLNETTDRLALHLRAAGIKVDVPVPVVIGRNINVIIAMLGIMKAGGVYVPIDPDYPGDRIGYLLADTAASLVLTDDSSCRKLPLSSLRQVILPDDSLLSLSTEDSPTLVDLPPASSLAYIIYTSGSTGTPKGVMIQHEQLATYLLDVYERMELAACESYGLLGTFAADAGHTAVFAALCHGKTLHILNIKNMTSPAALGDYFREFPIDCYKITPSLMDCFLREDNVRELLPRRRLILGGESCPWTVARQLADQLPPDCILFNHYGPTETTVGVITFRFPREAERFPAVIPLGQPLNHVQAYILNEDRLPVQQGATGELYIGGSLLARGYWHRPELTLEKFITHPAQGETGRLYRTGDLARITAAGDIEYIGRTDDQVKILGHRVELKEIEHVIVQTGLVLQCVVLLKINEKGTRCLTGYITPQAFWDKPTLLSLLRQRLPHYMIPTAWVIMQEWPLNFNYKIERQALPDPPEEEKGTLSPKAAPHGFWEESLLPLWQTLLRRDDIGLHDDFLQLGGNSLLLLRLSFAIFDRFKIELPASELFDFLTIATLAARLREKTAAATPDPQNDRLPIDFSAVTPTQKNLYIQHKLRPSESFPNSSLSLAIEGYIDFDRLESAFNRIIACHVSLRTFFAFEKGKVIRKTGTDFQFCLERLSFQTDDIDDAILSVTRPFDFGTFPLLRAFILILGNGKKFLHVDMPHIVSDGETMKIILDDLETLYNGGNLNGNRLQMFHVQQSLLRYRNSPQYLSDELYWKGQPVRDQSLFPLLSGRPQTSPSKFDGVCLVRPFPRELCSGIERYLEARRLTKFQLLLTAYFILLHELTSAEDIAVIVPVHNRNKPGFDAIVGLLSNALLISISVSPDSKLTTFVEYCSQAIYRALRHQQYLFEDYLKLWTEKGYDKRNLFNTFFGYHANREVYHFDETILRLLIPVRNSENLPLSAAVFEAGPGLTIRLSSTADAFSLSQLGQLTDRYYNTLYRILESNEKELVKNYHQKHKYGK